MFSNLPNANTGQLPPSSQQQQQRSRLPKVQSRATPNQIQQQQQQVAYHLLPREPCNQTAKARHPSQPQETRPTDNQLLTASWGSSRRRVRRSLSVATLIQPRLPPCQRRRIESSSDGTPVSSSTTFNQTPTTSLVNDSNNVIDVSLPESFDRDAFEFQNQSQTQQQNQQHAPRQVQQLQVRVPAPRQDLYTGLNDSAVRSHDTVEDILACLQVTPNNLLKAMMQALCITGGRNFLNSTKKKIIATKVVQRKICLSTLERLAHAIMFNNEDKLENSEELSNIRSIPRSSVKSYRDGREEHFKFRSGDIPVFEDGQVVVGMPVLNSLKTNDASTAQNTLNQSNAVGAAPFESNEYCRLMHVIADDTMTRAIRLLRVPTNRDREQQEDTEDPWKDHIVDLFNCIHFKPTKTTRLRDGILQSAIDAIDPSSRLQVRDSLLLNRKFTELKSEYSITKSDFQKQRQGEDDAFSCSTRNSYILYLHCLLGERPDIEDLFTTTLPFDKRLEEHWDGKSSNNVSNVDTRGGGSNFRDSSLPGLSDISAALKPQDTIVMKEIAKAERDRAKILVAEAKIRLKEASAKAIISLNSAIRDLNEMINITEDTWEKGIYVKKKKQLLDKLSELSDG